MSNPPFLLKRGLMYGINHRTPIIVPPTVIKAVIATTNAANVAERAVALTIVKEENALEPRIEPTIKPTTTIDMKSAPT